ncbi:hypothetical protein B0H13DRAFT_2070682 [Mycena leptocephala]|nr:hypothetical protein B0H13DRAFT_2070682 [Mycena leptocephala]
MFDLHRLGTRLGTYDHDILPLWNQFPTFSVPMDPRTPASSLNSEYDLRVASYVVVAFLTILIYDTLLNLGLEYHHIWKSKWGLIKCLYLWSRYGTFFDTILNVIRRLDMSVNLNPSSCTTLLKIITIFSGIGISIAESKPNIVPNLLFERSETVILMTRTYAIYGRSKKLLGFFIIMWLSIGGVATWAVINWTDSFKLPPESHTSCDLVSSSNTLLVCLVSLLAGETIIVLLTLWKGFRTFSLGGSALRSSRLVISFYRDGIMFYLAMLRTIVPSLQALFDQSAEFSDFHPCGRL